MKIVAIHTDFRLYWPARLKALDKALKEKDYSLEIVEIAGKGSPYSFANNQVEENLKWHILFPDNKPEELSGKKIKPKLFNLLDKINPDVILSGPIAFSSGALATQWVTLRKNKRLIIFDDAKIELVKRNPIVNFIKKNIYKGVDAMFYPAETWKSTGKYWGFKESQMFFGLNVVDNNFWSKSSNEYNFDFRYFVAVGRQIPQKNFISIIKGFHNYVEKNNVKDPFKLVMIGDGPDHKTILDYVKKNKLNNLVVFLPFISQDNLSIIYQNADLLCLCSKSETWGLVINEAMSAGCAIIASKECGATEPLVINNKNGYIISCDETEALSNAMINYHNLSVEEKNKMKESSRVIISKWGLDKFSKGVVDAADFVISNSKRKGNVFSKFLITKWFGRYNPV